MIKFSLSILFLMCTISPAFAFDFSIPTRDKMTMIHGQIDLPDCGQTRAPAVLFVGGTGLFTRNGHFGNSGTKRDFVFSYLSKKLNAACIATVRFDFRGVSCDLLEAASVGRCLNEELRKTVSDRTILDDIRGVYEFAASHQQIESSKIFILGHSEGSLNAARLVAEGLNPAGLLFIGGITESAKGILRWQTVERILEWAFEMDSDNDGVLTNEEIRLNFSNSKLATIASENSILSPSGAWTMSALSTLFESQYSNIVKSALESDDTAPYRNGGIIFSSMAWWKRWFTDDKSVLENLATYEGPIKYRNGDADSQTPGLREKNFLDNSHITMKSQPVFVIHEGKGHGLGPHPLLAPMDEDIVAAIVSDFTSWVR